MAISTLCERAYSKLHTQARPEGDKPREHTETPLAAGTVLLHVMRQELRRDVYDASRRNPEVSSRSLFSAELATMDPGRCGPPESLGRPGRKFCERANLGEVLRRTFPSRKGLARMQPTNGADSWASDDLGLCVEISIVRHRISLTDPCFSRQGPHGRVYHGFER
jgi:hypothetical protein